MPTTVRHESPARTGRNFYRARSSTEMGNCLCFEGEKDDKQERLIPQQPSKAPFTMEGGSVVKMGIRAFIIAKHERYGYLLLEANKKRKGGRHYQLPGGHVDRQELCDYGETEACRVAAARELYEETGLDLRNCLHRLAPIDLQAAGEEGNRYVFLSYCDKALTLKFMYSFSLRDEQPK
jgi:ADP-ribose pyrophosphatase YjhB (NUDIX family)